MVVTDGYYEIFNRPNVRLVSIKDTPIERFTADGVVVDGTEHPLDVVVLATGFDAISGAIRAMDVRGRLGTRIADAWADGPVSYLGLSIPEFPNYFLVAGPQSPSIFSNFIDAAEYSIDYTAALIQYAEREGWPCIEAEAASTEDWADGVNAIANATLYADTPGWYSGTNVEGKPRRWTAYLGVGPYRQVVEALAAEGYAGFRFAGDDSAATLA